MSDSIKVGYWRKSRDSKEDLPFPFLDRVDPEFHPDFAVKLRCLESKLEPELYRGWSMCRVCDKPNGSGEFAHAGFTWPSGYVHYIEEHGINPPDDFIDMVNAEA